jgi:hypothetical protein
MGDEGMSSTSRCPLPLLVGALGVVMTAGRSRLDGEAPSLAVMSGCLGIKNYGCMLDSLYTSGRACLRSL